MVKGQRRSSNSHGFRVALLASWGLVGALGFASQTRLLTVLCSILLFGLLFAVLIRGGRVRLFALSSCVVVAGVTMVSVPVPFGLALAVTSILLLVTRPTRPSLDACNPASSLEELMRGMASASGLRDQQTADHEERVAVNSLAVGLFLGLPHDDLARLEWAARLHDVGKVAVPQTILRKSGSLTPEELEAVRQHSSFGADILLATEPALAPIAHVVRHHHEHWDGSGYPAGLKGAEIPLESRIISVLDMYEALTSDRPYRLALAPAEAHREIMERSATQFDPDIIEVFDVLWERGTLAVSRHTRVRRSPATSPPVRVPDQLTQVIA